MRALERVYLRALLDHDYCARLSSPGFGAREGLSDDELKLLLSLPRETLAVERKGRRGHLWSRARAEMPRTLRRAEAMLASQQRRHLQHEIFSDLLWHPERTLDIPVFGRGYELATHVRDGLLLLAARENDVELSLLAAVARLEHAAFAAGQGPRKPDALVLEVTSPYQLLEAVEHVEARASSLHAGVDLVWQVTTTGRIGVNIIPQGQE